MSIKNLIKNLFYTYFKKDSHYYSNFNKNNIDHREYVGDKWDEIGKLQFDFLKNKGLKPQHKLIDIGCGSLRGGVHFINYLKEFNYFGTDINNDLIKLGIEKELNTNLRKKINDDNFKVSKNFDFDFSTNYFDYAIALSVFTHLRKSNIIMCLENLKKKIDKGIFFSTFFIVDEKNKDKPFVQSEQITSYSYKDPYHYTFNEIQNIANKIGFNCKMISDFHHPRNQKMISFIKKT